MYAIAYVNKKGANSFKIFEFILKPAKLKLWRLTPAQKTALLRNQKGGYVKSYFSTMFLGANKGQVAIVNFVHGYFLLTKIHILLPFLPLFTSSYYLATFEIEEGARGPQAANVNKN